MLIRKTTLQDLPQTEELYRRARCFMRLNGNAMQWGGSYPQKEILLKDIGQGVSYVCVQDSNICGVFAFIKGPDKTYKIIENGAWLNDEPYYVIHRFTTGGQRKGIGKFCLEWCLKQGKNIRIDTHKNNKPMLNLINKTGFKYCGIIYTHDGTERLAFQKKI